MKIKAKTGYKIVFWLFVIVTIFAYVWLMISAIRYIISI